MSTNLFNFFTVTKVRSRTHQHYNPAQIDLQSNSTPPASHTKVFHTYLFKVIVGLSFCWLESPHGQRLQESISITPARAIFLVVILTPNPIFISTIVQFWSSWDFSSISKIACVTRLLMSTTCQKKKFVAMRCSSKHCG